MVDLPHWPPLGADSAWVDGNPPPTSSKLQRKGEWFKTLILHLQEQGWPEDCLWWPWGPTASGGRPTMYHKGNAVPVTHVVLDMCGQPRPSKKHQALHSCDRGADGCVNLNHLSWGTELQNRLDQVARQRGSIGKSRIGLGKAYKIRDELLALAKKHDVTMEDIARIAGTRVWADESWETDVAP